MKLQNIILALTLLTGTSALAFDQIDQDLQNGKIEAAAADSREGLIRDMKTKLGEMDKIQEQIGLSETNSQGRLGQIGQLINIGTEILKEAQASADLSFVKKASTEVSNLHKEALLLKAH